MEIRGKVHEIGQIQQVTDTFKKRDIVIEYAENPSYPEFIKFEALQDKTDLFDQVAVGDNVEVFFNLRGRPWTNKDGLTTYFNTLVVWRITKVAGASDPSASAQSSSPVPPAVDISSTDGKDDDLPF